jgi:hypothetical protein
VHTRGAKPVAAVVCAVLGLVAAPAHAERVRPLGSSAPLGDERLSDERSLTRWANPNGRDSILARPRRGSAVLGRLRVTTEDGLPDVALVLRSQRTGDAVWLKVRAPGGRSRPAGIVGWVARDALAGLRHVNTSLEVDRRALRATLRRRGRVVWSSPIGIGARGTPTPGGRFFIRERLHPGAPGGIYGPVAFGTSAYAQISDWPGGSVVGIHGTNQPELIPGRPSHGCVRVPNAAMLRLSRLLDIGTPLRINRASKG